MTKQFNGHSRRCSRPLLSLFLLLSTILNAQSILDPDQFHGPRTKWDKYQFGTGGDTRATIAPNMRGLSMSVWYSTLEALGANSATFNLEARNGLLSVPIHENYDADGHLYFTEEQVNNYEFTPEQRNEVLLNFLQKVQDAYENNLIYGNIKFHVHQRLYPNNSQKEQDFIRDFSDFINAAKAANLDHWIAGIRLGENGIETTSINKTLRLSKEWATAINLNTNNWLKTHGLEMSGAKMGLYFNNIHNSPNSNTFFQEISQETGYFTFCYKHFNQDGFNNDMTTLGYNTNNVEDWKTYLNNDCGFADLKNFITSNRTTYPMHANVIFIGDSGDAMKQINNVQYEALTDLFSEAGEGFSGIIGVNGYTWDFENGLGDVYKNMHIVDPTGSTPQLQPLSKKRWQHWPLNDNNSSNLRIIDAMSSYMGTILPSGPIPLTIGNSQTFIIAPIDGYDIDDVLVDGISQGPISSYTFNNVINTHRIQAKFKLSALNIDEVSKNEKINLYPNPVTNGKLKLNIENANIQKGDTIFIRLFTTTGQLIFENELSYQHVLSIPIDSKIIKGLYIISITKDEKVLYKKIIIK